VGNHAGAKATTPGMLLLKSHGSIAQEFK